VSVYIVRRLLLSIPVLIAASIVVFFGLSIVGDPLGELRTAPNVSQATIDLLTQRKHLDQPLIVQYGYWVQSAVTDRFGTTLLSDQPIWPNLRRALWHTLQLVVIAEVLSLGIGILLGVISAKRQYSIFDYAVTTISFLGYSIPIFWFALILQVLATNFFVATGTRVFYTAGLSSVDPGTGFAFLIDRLQHLALPILALAYVSVALYSRYMRSSMLEVINADYVRTARAKGLRESAVTRKHALRNAMIPIVTLAALNFGSVVSGVIVTETVFALDGMGLFFIRALGAREVYSIMAFLMVTSIFVVIGNLLADILYGYLDPRIRYE
jgi:peptide/nickel transport system permease protein